MDPREPEPTHRLCEIRDHHVPACLIEGHACGPCRYQAAIDDGDLVEAGHIADDFGLVLVDGEVYPRGELPTVRAGARVAVPVCVPRAPALPVFATAREREFFLPERVPCREAFDPAGATTRPTRAA